MVRPTAQKPGFLSSWLAPLLDPLACLEEPTPPTEQRDSTVESLVRRLTLQLHRKLKEGAPGGQRSLMRGQGLDFINLREYAPGDDIRKIDWNVFARTFSPFIREYREEKELTVWLVVDLSPSMFFGQHRAKAQVLLDWVGLLSLVIQHQGHRLGLYVYWGAGCRWLEPRRSEAHTRHLLGEIMSLVEQESTSVYHLPADYFQKHCETLSRLVTKRATVFFLSDFLMPGDTAWASALGSVSRQCDFYFLQFVDPSEQEIPEGLGLVPFFDPETQESVWFDGSDPASRQAYQEACQQQEALLLKALTRLGHPLRVLTTDSPVESLLQLFTYQRPMGVAP